MARPASIEMMAPMTISPGSIPASPGTPHPLARATPTAAAAAIAPPTHCWKNTETRRFESHTWVRWMLQATISASRPTIHRAPNMSAAALETAPKPRETSSPPQRP